MDGGRRSSSEESPLEATGSGMDTEPLLPVLDPSSSNRQSCEVSRASSGASVAMSRTESACWWLIGILNNISFVICAASAKDIVPSSVALVFLANSFPSLCVRISAPYWFDRVSYQARMRAASALFAAGFSSAALFKAPLIRVSGVHGGGVERERERERERSSRRRGGGVLLLLLLLNSTTRNHPAAEVEQAQ